jgi:hypothetical protein
MAPLDEAGTWSGPNGLSRVKTAVCSTNSIGDTDTDRWAINFSFGKERLWIGLAFERVEKRKVHLGTMMVGVRNCSANRDLSFPLVVARNHY